MNRTMRVNPAVPLLVLMAVVVTIGALALTGPAVGNIFSSTVSSLGGDAPQSAPVRAAQEPLAADGSTTLVNELEARERVILHSASLRIVVSDTEVALDDIAAMAEEFGGWVVSSNISQVLTASGEETARGSILVRVEAERLDEALDRVKSGAVSVETESVTGEDVTQQYIDLTSRLNNLEAAETQLQIIMEDARRTEDVMNVYNQLVQVRGNIETLRGQIQYYDESAAFSSINVELMPQALETPIQIAGWSPEGTARSAFLALLNVLRFIVDLIITLGVLVLPLVVIVGVPGWWLYRRARRRKVS